MTKQDNPVRNEVLIVLALYEPNLQFLEKQLLSLVSQTYQHWECLILDDSPSSDPLILNLIRIDSRFTYKHNRHRMGVFHNFEKGLYESALEFKYTAFSDQDDEWLPEKLEIQVKTLEANPEVAMVHSDLMVINSENAVLTNSLWREEFRKVKYLNPLSLVIKNSITGCTVLLRSSLLEKCLPFPPQGRSVQFFQDLWLGLLVGFYGTIISINTPLVRYRTRENNLVGPILKDSKFQLGIVGKIQNLSHRFAMSAYLLRLLMSHLDGKQHPDRTKIRDLIQGNPLRLLPSSWSLTQKANWTERLKFLS